MLTMHLFQPLLVVKMVNLKFDPVCHIFNVDISDGIHYIPAIVDLDSQCYVDFAFEDVDVCDFFVVKESVGHPATFDFRLVSILNNCFNCLKVIIDGQSQPRGARCILFCMITPPILILKMAIRGLQNALQGLESGSDTVYSNL